MDCDAYRDQMLDLLYGEASEPARRAVEAHQASCASCHEELAAFRRLRRELSSWTVPAAPRARRPAAAWAPLALAASALLALGAAVALAGAEVRHDERGWSLSLGRPSAALQARLQEQEARHQAEMEQLRARLVTPAAPEREAVMASVRQLMEQSERRQDARLEHALAQLSERHETQRRYDLAQVSAGLSYLEGKAGLHAARTTELVGQVLLASQEK